MSGIRQRLTFANVVSVIALFVALGGGAYAVSVAKKNSVVSKSIKNGQVKTKDLAKNVVKSSKVADNSLGGVDIRESSLAAVPNATNADHATSADRATTADSAPPSGTAGGDLTGTYPNPSLRTGEPWHEVQSFDTCTVNPTTIAWTNIGSPYATASYYRDQLGIVHLSGAVKCPGGVAYDYSIFPLPPGYRPASLVGSLAATGSGTQTGFTGVTIGPSGIVSNAAIQSDAAHGASVRLSLDGITFRCGPSGQNGCP